MGLFKRGKNQEIREKTPGSIGDVTSVNFAQVKRRIRTDLVFAKVRDTNASPIFSKHQTVVLLE